MEPGWEVTTANRLDMTYRDDAQRLRVTEPWFGEIAVKTAARTVLSRIGKKDDRAHRIVDWRHPFGKAYYQLAPGDDFDMEEFADDGASFASIQGVCEHQAQVMGGDGALQRVVLQTEGQRWDLQKDGDGFSSGGAPRRPSSTRGLPDITPLLTPDQYRLITRSRRRPLIIQGRAGSGKTSVALFRVAWLAYPEAEPGETPVDKSKVLIVMFNKALSAFAAHSLKPLGLEGVKLDTFHGWALEQIREAYTGDLEVDSWTRASDPTAVARVKKQIGILRALEAFVARQTATMKRYLQDTLGTWDKEGWRRKAMASTKPPAVMLRELRTEARLARDAATGRKAKRLQQVYKVFDATVRRFTRYKDELLRFLSDTELLAEHCTGVGTTDFEVLTEYQRAVQLKGGDIKKPGPNVTFDDFALLLRLIQLKNGGFPKKDSDGEPMVFDHLVIDEAQDFGAVELKALMASVRSKTGVTIVGDLNQKIIPDAAFMGWDNVAEELGVEGAEVAKLEISHRSSGGIIAAADAVGGTTTLGGFEGYQPELVVTEDWGGSAEAIHDWAEGIFETNPDAHVCVVCRWPKQAKATLPNLQATFEGTGVDVREGHNKSFQFAPGITVTNASQIKGLEFDAVAILDPTETYYPDTLDSRRLLYTVITRAKERLLFVTHKALSPPVQQLVDDDLIDDGEGPVPEFNGEDDDPFEADGEAAVAEFEGGENEPF